MQLPSGTLLAATLFLLAAPFAPPAEAQVLTSHFDLDDEGWTILGYNPNHHIAVPAGTAVTYDTAFGNPLGSIRAGDVYWGTAVAAPPSFLGDRRAYFGGSLDYDIYLRNLTVSSLTSALLVSTDHTLYFVDAAPTLNAWTARSYPLVPGSWQLDSSTGPLATSDDLLGVLADLRGIWIVTEWAVGSDDTNVDNPTLAPPLQGGVVPFGVGLDPAGSLIHMAGAPLLGSTLTLGIDDPTGQKPIGSLPFLVLSVASQLNFPSGLVLPGLGMGGAATSGELLLDLTPAKLVGSILAGPPWTGAGNPAPFLLSVPSSPVLVGLCVYAQGVLFDPSPMGGLGLTHAVQITLGS